MTTALQLRIRGQVTSAICGTTRKGVPVLDVHLTDAQTGQHVELDATNPRFRSRRLDCDAEHIGLPYQTPSTRKDLE
jgi:hypothetical protein